MSEQLDKEIDYDYFSNFEKLVVKLRIGKILYCTLIISANLGDKEEIIFLLNILKEKEYNKF